MKLLCLDFETYWAADYTLSKMTTESYVRDPRFKAHGCGFQWVGTEDNDAGWLSGDVLTNYLRSIDWKSTATLCHHAAFDNFILSHHYGIIPAMMLDTLSMARAVIHRGQIKGHSLALLADYYSLGRKGHEVENTKGIRDLAPVALARLGDYCLNDIDLTIKVFHRLRQDFPKSEYPIVDMVLRMFVDPSLELDQRGARVYLAQLQAEQEARLAELVDRLGFAKADLMSNPKFALALESLGVDPPLKVSPTTGKETFAFGKTDPGFKELLDSEDDDVVLLCETRAAVKSTINRTRAERMLGNGERGPITIYLNYSGAQQTHRLSGGDKSNFQNQPRPKPINQERTDRRIIMTPDGPKPGDRLDHYDIKECHEYCLRDTLMAPPGHSLVVVDSANIEARVLAWLAQQDDALYRFENDIDPYCYLASKIYERPITKKDKVERQCGKVATLGLGYGMGDAKFLTTADSWGIDLDPTLAKRIVDIFRTEYNAVKDLWDECQEVLYAMTMGESGWYRNNFIYYTPRGLTTEAGLVIHYPQLERTLRKKGKGYEYSYMADRKRNKIERIYGGKVVENLTQHVARNVVMQQTLALHKQGWKVALSAHDEAVLVVPEEQAEEARDAALATFRTRPSWAPDLPLDAEAGIAKYYGLAK